MSAPDFSRDPERVALAKVLYEAACCPNFGDALSFEEMRPSRQQYYLRMADAAITHLGSGYRLPKATEENAERLARDEWAAYCRTQKAEGELFAFDNQTPFVKRQAIEKALEHLGALHAAFGEQEKPAPSRYDFCQCQHQRQTHDGLACGAFGCDCKGFTSRVEKPEPVFAGTTTPQPQCTCNSGIRQVCYAQHHVTDTCTATSGDYHCELPTGHGGEHSAGRIAWEEEAGEEPLKEDFAAQAAEIERKRLVEAFMRDMVSNPAVMAKMLENYEADEDAIAARLHEIALAFAQELIG